ncbi:hypothetical protein PHMEG_00023112 [Phytophthora megakarya]|uniref:Uncharacterized protein n=1 Tax=Phytophthora megakarya TaxID=4795 RepID=A0A225VIH6_9STRA|nr:hypothetical protein PHMEG_00023112 [Phytophthora megakarya]
MTDANDVTVKVVCNERPASMAVAATNDVTVPTASGRRPTITMTAAREESTTLSDDRAPVRDDPEEVTRRRCGTEAYGHTRHDDNEAKDANVATTDAAASTVHVNHDSATAGDVNDRGDDDEPVLVEDYTLQLTDDEIVAAQKKMQAKNDYGLVTIETVHEPARYDNFVLRREDKTGKIETIITQVSFLARYHYPEPLLTQVALYIDEDLQEEDLQPAGDESPVAAVVFAAMIPAVSTIQPRGTKRTQQRLAVLRNTTTRVDSWWNDIDADVVMEQISTYWNTNSFPAVIPTSGGPTTKISGFMTDMHAHDGRLSITTNDGYIGPNGSRKTVMERKT